MAVRKEVTVQHGFSQEEIAEAVKATLLRSWGYEELSPGTFESDIGWTWGSWGEWFTVDITREGIIKIASKSKVPTTLFDFGKNQKNLKRFLNALKRTFSTSGQAKSKPEAYTSFISDERTHIRSPTPGENMLSFFLMVIFLFVSITLVLGLLFLVPLAFILLLLSQIS